MGGRDRLRGAVGVGVAQLARRRRRAVLAVVGVALAVALVATLGGLGYGMAFTGERALSWIEFDLWVTSGTVGLAPGSVGGVDNPIRGAHELSDDVGATEGVGQTQSLAFQTVYVSPNGSEFDTVVGVGVGNGSAPKGHPAFEPGDPHYAGGSYDGPMTREIVVNRELADRYGLSVGDELHVGATLVAARENEFTVVAVTGRYSNFLGAPTVAMHLSELQEVSGTTGTDPATLVALTVDPGADPAAVADRIERRHPDLTVRTTDRQLRAVVGGHATVLTSAATLVGLALVAGGVLVTNVLALLVHQQREALAALKAVGVSGRTLVVGVGAQGAVVGLFGGALGVVLAVPLVALANGVAADVSGFPNLIKTPWWLLAGAAGLGVATGVLGSSVAGWRVASLRPLAVLRR